MLLRHGWGWQPLQTTSLIHIRHIQNSWAHWDAVQRHTVAALYSYTHYLCQILGFWVTCPAKMMPLSTGWGWQPPQTASPIHTGHIKSFRAHWYTVLGIQLQPYTVIPILFGPGFGALGHMLRCNDAIMSRLRLRATSNHFSPIHIRHIECVWSHWYAVQRHTGVAALYRYTHPTWLWFWGSGSHVELKWCHYVMVEGLHPLQTTSPIHIRHINK